MPEEKVKKVDRRVIKTKRAICNAFTELLATKDFNDITITDIAVTADVNRKTIYNYYNGIYEILDEIEDNLVKTFLDVLKNLDEAVINIDPFTIFDALTESLNENLEFYARLLNIKNNSKLVDKIISSLKKELKANKFWNSLFKEDMLDVITDFIVSGMLASYYHWFNTGRKMPLHEFSKNVGRLICSGIDSYIIRK